MKMLFIILASIVLLLLALCIYIKYSHGYWQRIGVPVLAPSFPFGNFRWFFLGPDAPTPAQQHAANYARLKSTGARYGGVYSLHAPYFVPIDLAIIKDIMLKRFDAFDERGMYFNDRDQPITGGLFLLGGDRWRRMRTRMTPIFTGARMRMLFDVLLHCRRSLDAHLASVQQVDMRFVGSNLAIDAIGSSAFGIECDSFRRPDSTFRKFGCTITMPGVDVMFIETFPALAHALRIKPLPRDVERYFVAIITDTVTQRRERNIVKNDFLQMFMALEEAGDITFDELLAQAFILFVAGSDTSSNTITFCMFELAKHADIQERVHTEINEVLAENGDELTYDMLAKFTYMRQVIDETLRLYPVASDLGRNATKPWRIPGAEHITLPVGTHVRINVLGLHHDPEYFPDPQRFDPDRFAADRVASIKPYSYIPFGDGPRLCIGKRFAIMQITIALVGLLKNYRYTLSAGTKEKVHYNMSFILAPRDPILLDVERI